MNHCNSKLARVEGKGKEVGAKKEAVKDNSGKAEEEEKGAGEEKGENMRERESRS